MNDGSKMTFSSYFTSVCLFVCLEFWISTLGWRKEHGPKKNLSYFGTDLNKEADPGFYFQLQLYKRKKDLPVVVKPECWRKRKILLPIQCSCAGYACMHNIFQQGTGCTAWLREAAWKKENFLVSPICTSFCWTFTVSMSINTFLHPHPFICLCSNGNKCVGGINQYIFLKLTNEQFVPMVMSSQECGVWMLLCQSWINAVCSHIYRTLRHISSVFQNFHKLEEPCGVTVTPKHQLDAEWKNSWASVFKLRMSSSSVWCCIPVCILKLAVINVRYKSLSSCFKAGTFIHSHEVTSVACIKPSKTTDVRSFLLRNHNCLKMSSDNNTCISVTLSPC